MGTGGAALVAAGVSTAVRSSAISEIDEACPSHQNCDPSLRETQDHAQRYGVMAGALAVVGTALVAGGVGILLLMPDRESNEPAQGVSVALFPNATRAGGGVTGVMPW
jgi:hypothetical protein